MDNLPVSPDTLASDNFLPGISAFLRRHLPSGPGRQRLCIGLSGGMDSVVLLHALAALRDGMGLELSALHVHHGLSPHAEDWTAFCMDLCRRLDVRLAVERVEVARESGRGVEAAAREARYGAFWRCGADFMVLAHHRDDQAETLLLNLLRGAGVHGAAGMPAARALAAGGPLILRPLLDVPRTALSAWAQERGLAWIEDESNLDGAYSRNFLRHRIVPELKARFPGSDAALARAASHFAEGAELLDELAVLDMARARQDGGLSVARLGELSAARSRNLLRHWLREQGVSVPDTEALNEALHQLLTARAEAAVAVDIGAGLSLRRFRGAAHLVRAVPPPPPMRWQGEAELPWAGGRLVFRETVGEGISAARLAAGQVVIRLRQPGDRLQPNPKRPSRTLKNLLQESAVMPWLRTIIPFMECGGRLVWVADLGVDAGWQCGAAEDGIGVEWLPHPHPQAVGQFSQERSV